MRDRHGAGLLAAGWLVLAGCSLAPTYERPAAPVAPDWPTAPPPTAPNAVPAQDLGWRDVMGDARLQALVALALASNRDLRLTSLNVDLARARFGIQRAALFPEVDATGNFIRSRTPLDQSVIGQPYTSSQWNAGVAITAWELDLFGRVRNLKDAALETWLGTEEARRGASLSLVAETADLYLLTRALDEQEELARRTLDLVTTSYRLTKRRYEVGQVSELDLRTSEVQVETAHVNLASLAQQRSQAEDALVLLVGQPLPQDLPPPAPLDASGILADIPAGLPSDLVERRPDVLAAEHDLKAANANIGAARAAFFPSITLTAFAGLSSVQLGSLFDQTSGAWLFTPKVNLPIFTAGRNTANLEAAKIERQIAVARYEKAIQVAFREVADALAARGQIETQIEAGAARVAAGQRRYELADLRFRKGVDSSLVVLSAQQDLFAFQELLVKARLARLENLIDLYRALGGGWLERTRTRTAGE